MSRISLVQLAGSVRKCNLNRPFICPILSPYSAHIDWTCNQLNTSRLAFIVIRFHPETGGEDSGCSFTGVYK